jgi:hypothetical protein
MKTFSVLDVYISSITIYLCYKQTRITQSITWGFIFFDHWSERSACAALGCCHKCRWPLFLVIIPLGGTTVIKTQEGVVIGIQIFAWAPN